MRSARTASGSAFCTDNVVILDVNPARGWWLLPLLAAKASRRAHFVSRPAAAEPALVVANTSHPRNVALKALGGADCLQEPLVSSAGEPYLAARSVAPTEYGDSGANTGFVQHLEPKLEILTRPARFFASFCGPRRLPRQESGI